MTVIDPGTGSPGRPFGAAQQNGAGVCLVVESPGVVAGALAEAAVAQYAACGMLTEKVGIDLLELGDLNAYTGLIVTMPDDIPRTPAGKKMLKKLASTVERYRAQRREGIAAVFAGSPPFKAGVVQLTGTPNVLSYAEIRSLTGLICRIHRLDPKAIDPMVDFLGVYTPADPAIAESQIDRNIREAWEYLSTWNITTVDEVWLVWRIFEECIQRYEDKKFTALHRPVPGNNTNRLTILLYEPNTPAPHISGDYDADRAKWVSDGARVARYTVEQIQASLPDVSRPDQRGGSKDAQPALRLLHANLRHLMKSPEFRSANEKAPDTDPN
ncbi:hypothetical protein ACWIGW_44285 [Nocardia brasiliensis]|uniref:hypothetical protein n=1 Tax=Streptomyces sp. NPDC056056 TaxID=3345698 RepID=UPI0035D53B16